MYNKRLSNDKKMQFEKKVKRTFLSAYLYYRKKTGMINKLIQRYNLQKHPEGGYYAETYRSKMVIESPIIRKQQKNLSRFSLIMHICFNPLSALKPPQNVLILEYNLNMILI